MRYLWVEDFDGGKSGQTETKFRWEAYFELKDKTINDYRTLESVLEFLDNHLNWRLFDAVLIDIRFKVCSKEHDEKNIYDKYFSSFLTEEKFQYYANKINDDPDAATSGVLLYLALIYRYHYNQDRIAFISANINASSGDSSELACFRKMREIIAKARFRDMSPTDKDDFSGYNEDAYVLYEKNGKADDCPIPETEDINWECLDELEKNIMNAEREIIDLTERPSNGNHNRGDNLKYNSVKEEFEKLGLKVPIAFEKPDSSEHEEISWLFKEWQERKLGEDEYYKLRSNILDICLSIQKLLEESESSSIVQKDIFLEGKFQTDEIKQLFFNIMLLFPENSWVDENMSLYPKVIKACVAIFEKIEHTYECDKIEVLKFTRNWMSHQGIKDITAHGVVFIFHIMINVLIHIERNKDLQNKDNNLIKEFSKDIKERSVEEINDIICKKKEKYRQMYEEGRREFLTNQTENNNLKRCKKLYEYDGKKVSFYKMLSDIGHECSPKRKQVSMQMLYVLYLLSLNITEDVKEDFFVQSVLNEVCQE